jgi:ATP-binding cassette subfamily G (WHITE) protein 2
MSIISRFLLQPCRTQGPSGAGKTSLLDVLAGRKTVGTVTGSVRINGRDLSPREMRLLSGYVVQDDILPQMLTVRECLDFQARLRVPSGGAPSRVDTVMRRLKLLRTSNTLVGGAFRRGISGGEKRRVSVAIELLSEPAILFLDEPTTGQDSTTAVMLCQALRQIAKVKTELLATLTPPLTMLRQQDGTTVVMSIHQPRIEIFEMMTQIIFLTREGRVAYCGPTAHLASYIQRSLGDGSRLAKGANPSDDLLDVMGILEPQVLVDRYRESGAGAAQRTVLALLEGVDQGTGDAVVKRLIAERGKYRASWPEQFLHIAHRAVRNALRNPFPFLLHGVTAAVTAVALGIVFKDIHEKDAETAGTQDRFGIMFFLVLYLSLLALTSLPLWREDQLLFVAERGSGIYSTSPYVLASLLFDVLPYRLLPPLAFTLVSYPLIGLNDLPGHRSRFFLVLFACNLAVSGVCLLIGVLTSSNASANAAGSLAMLTSLLFSGFLLNKTQIPHAFTWILDWAPGNYAFEALSVNEFDGLTDLYITSTISHEKISAGPFTGEQITHCFGFKDHFSPDLTVLLIMSLGYCIGVLIVMKCFIKEKR